MAGQEMISTSLSASWGPLTRQLRDFTDALDVVLVVQDVRFQGVGLLGAQGVAERAIGHRDRGRTVDHLEHVLGLALIPLLAEPATDLRVGLHEDPRLSAVDSGVPAALGADDPAATVQLGGVLAEVPDVATTVLGVVVAGPLGQDVVQIEPVLDHAGSDPIDQLGPPGSDKQVQRLLAVLCAGVDQCLPWREGKESVGDVRAEHRRFYVGMVVAARAEPRQMAR